MLQPPCEVTRSMGPLATHEQNVLSACEAGERRTRAWRRCHYGGDEHDIKVRDHDECSAGTHKSPLP